MTRSLCLKVAVMLSLATVAGASVAADAPAPTAVPQSTTAQAPAEELDDLDEIWIRGKHLSEVIEKAEDDFFVIYNKVNKNNQFDVFCGRMALNEGSMIMVRKCTPRFVVNNSYDVMTNSISYGYSTGCSGYSSGAYPYTDAGGVMYYQSSCQGSEYPRYPQVPPELLLMEKRASYARNVFKVVRSDPRLLDMAKKLGGLYDEMDLAQRHYVKVKGVATPVKPVKPAKPGRKPVRFPAGRPL